MMTACDLSASAKPWELQVKTAQVIFEEFYQQVLNYCMKYSEMYFIFFFLLKQVLCYQFYWSKEQG